MFCLLDTGEAVGGTSHLLLIPEKKIVIAILVNMQKVDGLKNLCLDIADEFMEEKIH